MEELEKFTYKLILCPMGYWDVVDQAHGVESWNRRVRLYAGAGLGCWRRANGIKQRAA